MSKSDGLIWLKKAIEEHVFLDGKRHRIVNANGAPEDWLFDFRRLMLTPKALRTVTELFYQKLHDLGRVQIGGMETAAIPLVTASVLAFDAKGADVTGFYIRKSRKKHGLLNAVEGTLTDAPVILMDDLMNRGTSFLQQIRVLEDLGHTVHAVCVVLRYRNIEAYEELTRRGIRIISLFALEDFTESLGLAPLQDTVRTPIPQPFTPKWRFKAPEASLFHVIPHSAPILDEKHLYFGGDNGTFWCLQQSNGAVRWSFQVPYGVGSKVILSSPALYKNLVIFGAYDGNVYALDKETGKRTWTNFDADWIGSSPTIALDLGLVFIGLEFSVPNQEGGIIALRADTGEVVWISRDMPMYTHASPLYSGKHRVVLCGSNDGMMRAYDAQTGAKLWSIQTGGDIKYGVALSEDEHLAAFGSFDGYAYVVETKSGKLSRRFKTDASIYSTPLFDDNRLYVASLDKHLYCFDIISGDTHWSFNTGARIYSTPRMNGEFLYLGANNGRLFRINKKTGIPSGIFQATERIVNAIARSEVTGHIFLPTFANEIYCLIEP